MIKATRELLDYLKQTRTAQNWEVLSAFSNIIEIHGGTEDGEAVGEYLLEHQGNYHLDELYKVVLKLGNADLARKFFQSAVTDGELKEGFDLEVLEIFGKFQLEEARPLLVQYALGEPDYYRSLHAVRGLLNYDCEDLQDRIRTSIESIYNKSLYNELVPALVCKLQDRTEVLERLYVTGTEYCSTDSNAGILLGFSLCGVQGLPYFKKAIFNPAWEAHYPSRFYVAEGMENLGITFSELFREILAMEDSEKQEYGLQLLLSLLEVKISYGKIKLDARESFSDLKQEFFSLKGGRTSGELIEFAEKFGQREEAYKLEELLRLRLREETVLRCL